MDDMYKRRQGIAWQNNLYLNLLQFVDTNNIVINGNTYSSLSTQQLEHLSTAVFPKYGHRRSHKDKVLFFLQCYYETIIKDLSNFNSQLKVINAPELQEWFDYKKELIMSMRMLSIRVDINKFLTDPNYQLALPTKLNILRQMYRITGDKDIEPSLLKKLNNTLWFNRKEICNEVSTIIFNRSLNENNVDKEDFYGFTSREKSIAITSRKILDSIINRFDAESKGNDANKISNYIINETNQDKSLIPDVPINKNINSLKRKIRKRSVISFDKVCDEDVLEFFKTKGANDQIELLKKLIILNMVSKNNSALKKFMTGTIKISHQTKRIILESIYDDDILKEDYYSFLDLLMSKRYLIKQKVKEINNLLKINSINFQKELEYKMFFKDLEPIFYETLQKLSSAGGSI